MQAHKTHDAVVAGHICLDLTPHFPPALSGGIGAALAPGKLVRMEGIEISTGGAVSNTGIALSLMGAKTLLMCAVGGDSFGSIVRELVARHGDDSGVRTVQGARTSYTVVLVPPETDRIFLHDPGANDTFSASDIDYDQVAQARLFHFGYPPVMERMYTNDGAQLLEIFERVNARGVTTSLDMAFPGVDSPAGRAPWAGILKRLLPTVDVFLPSLEEILLMLDRPRYLELNEKAGGREILDVVELTIVEELAARLIDLGVALAGIKCGKHGIYFRTASPKRLAAMGSATPTDLSNWGNRSFFAPSYRVDDLKSATGAGDSSIAGFLAALLADRSIERAADLACLAGANTTRVYDALSGVEALERMEARLDEGPGPKRNEVHAAPSAWRRDPARGHWDRGTG